MDDTIPLYMREFPEFDRELEFPPGFVDTSWHNDACPSMWNEALRVTVFCDWLRYEMSDWQGTGHARENYRVYSMGRTDEHGAIIVDIGEGTNDWQEVLSRIEAVPPVTPEQWQRVDELRKGINGSSIPMAVVDYFDRVDHEQTKIPLEDTDRRFGVRDMRHVQIYGLRVVALNDKARYGTTYSAG